MSLILLQSEKQISPQIKDSSDNPQDFVNIFRKPIEIEDNQTIELVSIAYTKTGDITINGDNDTMIYRIGDNGNYLNKTVKMTHGTYTPTALATEIEKQLNNTCVLNQYNFSVLYSSGSGFITINLNQTSNPGSYLTNEGLIEGDELEFQLVANSDELEDIDTLEFTENTVMSRVQYESGSVFLESATSDQDFDWFDELYYTYTFDEKGLFSNAPVFSSELYPQFHISGINTGAAISAGITFSDNNTPANTGNLAAYTGSNGYDSQFTVNAITYYLKYVSNYTGSVLNAGDVEIAWYSRGEYIIVSNTDAAIPSSIDKTTANFGLCRLEYLKGQTASLTTLSQDLYRLVDDFETIYGINMDIFTFTDIEPYITYATVGYKNSSIGLSRDANPVLPLQGTINPKLGSDYSIYIEQESKTLGTTDTIVNLKCHGRNNTAPSTSPSWEDKDFFYTLTSGGGEVGPVSLLSLEAAGITVSGASMENIRLSIGTLSGVKSKITFKIEKSSSPGMWSTVATGRFENDSIFTEDFYPLRGDMAISPGSYGQNLGTNDAFIVAGNFSLASSSDPTTKNLNIAGITDADFEVSESPPVEGATFQSKQQLSMFFRFGVVPDNEISFDNTAGANLLLIDVEDVENQGRSRNNTLNNADLTNIISFKSFTRFNAGTNDFAMISGTGAVRSTEYLNENLNIQLPDFPIQSFNGVIGQPENCVAIIPAEQIQTDANTGKLYYQSSIPNKINMNNNGKQKVNHMRVRLTTPEGQPITNLTHPTSVVLKIDRKSP